MTEYLCTSEKPYLMILEDDFRFKPKADEINEILHWFMDKSRGDVLMMNCSCAMLVPDGNSEGEYTVNRVLSSNSMAGFVIKRGHVRELIGVLLDSLRSHESVGHIYQNLKSQGRREAFRPILNMICNDRVWVNLQTSHRYLTLTPSIGSTVESYSDIESRTVNYRHMEVQ
jgi:GR25 family glycosyltransferase involved in LPS biosynthesis